MVENIAYLLKYDTVYGRYEREVSFTDRNLIVDGKEYKYLSGRDPVSLPWGTALCGMGTTYSHGR
jgi:glyceraldehyde 3-phosphate dehydrogenase